MSTPTIIEYLSEQLEQTRENHPSFKLMNNRIDESLFPKGIITFEAEAYDSNEKLKTVKEIVEDSWNKGKKNHLMIEGEGGIGKTVTLLSLPDKIASHPVPAIYIPLHDIRGTGDEDLIEKHIKMEVLEEDEELFRQLKTLRKTKWEKGPVLLLLLDGFNELSSDTLRGSVSRDIERWAKYPGIQIITSSRYDIHNYVSLQSDFSKIELQRISKEKVCDYLDRVNMPIPTDAALLELITNPLLLTLYIKTEIIRSQRSSSFARFKETKNAGTLIWNYLQCELWRFRNDQINDAKPGVIAMEFIAPYIAWKMQQQSCFSLSELEFNTLVKEAHASLEAHIANPSELPSHISIILQQSNELPQRNRLSILLKEYLGIFVEFKEKDKHGNDTVRFKLMHQQFRDALAAMHLINLSYLSGNSLHHEWETPIDFYVMRFVVDLINKEEANRLWEQNRKTVFPIDDATRNQLRLQGLLHNNDYSHLDFSGLDLGNISLYPYRYSIATLKLPIQPKRMNLTKISDKTFSPEGHENSVTAVAVTPDGERIVSGSEDSTIRVWNLETGEPIGKAFEGHEFSVDTIAVTPDGKRIVSGGFDSTIRIWNIDTGEQIGKSIEGHKGRVATVAVTPDGKHIVSGSWDHTIRVWNLETGEQIGNPIKGHKGRVTAVVVTPDGKHIVSGSEDCTIRVWDLATGMMIGKPIKGHEGQVNAVTVTSGGKCIVSGSEDKTIRVWNIKTGEPMGRPLEGHIRGVAAVAVTPNGKRIISGSSDNTVRVWNIETGNPIGKPLEGNEGWVNAVTVTPDGKRIVSGSDYSVRVWNLETGEPIGKPIERHKGWVNVIAIIPNAKCIVSGLGDSTIRVWNLATGMPIGKPIEGHKDSVTTVAVTPDGERIVSGSDDNTIRVWNLATGTPIGKPIEGHKDSVTTVAITPDGKRIVSGSYDKTIRVWDLASGEPIGKPIVGHQKTVVGIAVIMDGKRIVSGSLDGTIRVWNLETGALIGKPIERLRDSVQAIAVTPDGKRVVSVHGDGTIFVWNLKTGAPTREPIEGYWNQVEAVAVTPNGKRIISGSDDCTIRVWNLATGNQIGKPIEGHEDSVTAVAVTPDGNRIVSGSFDRTIRIWNLKTGEKQTIQVPRLSLVGLDLSKAIFSTPELKETLRQNGAKVDPD